MSEERLARIEGKVDLLINGQIALQQAATGLEQGHAALRAGQEDLRRDHEDLGRQMRVLHEITRNDIRDLAPDLEPMRREFKAADAELREDIDRRLTPLEAWARDHRT